MSDSLSFAPVRCRTGLPLESQIVAAPDHDDVATSPLWTDREDNGRVSPTNDPVQWKVFSVLNLAT